MALRILVVEDEPEMAALLARGLRGEGYTVDTAGNGIDGITLAQREPYDIAVLDVMLPGMSGFELCRRLREHTNGMAILLLTARDAVDDRVRGLDSGADDYLTKPFEFAELAARLRALRRRDAIGASRLDIGGLQIDMTRHEITAGGTELRLSRTEFDLLRLLAENSTRVMPRAEIIDSIWGSVAHIDPNIVDQYVSYVRRKLETVGSPVRIATTRGVGFQLIALDQ
ncbi:response regulator transcription factor [Salinibacterium sp. G-O1]|uniref:response regulator transcription factor n=1 Tax=Salinibacterium sp. G-O1 TaxID=3046208 RepID=UPI0024BB3754|nr:response regulator transcription factor [Salinibacterium sp. G-O1]MDJ0334402.1 response regulator transcription factor [Salinibacterium sp. G-O1]